jgi:hypothetical protein
MAIAVSHLLRTTSTPSTRACSLSLSASMNDKRKDKQLAFIATPVFFPSQIAIGFVDASGVFAASRRSPQARSKTTAIEATKQLRRILMAFG